MNGLTNELLWVTLKKKGGIFLHHLLYPLGFPCGSAGKESAYNAGDLGSIPGLGRSPGEGKGHPLQYSGLENGGHKESDTTERLSLHVAPCGTNTFVCLFFLSRELFSLFHFCTPCSAVRSPCTDLTDLLYFWWLGEQLWTTGLCPRFASRCRAGLPSCTETPLRRASQEHARPRAGLQSSFPGRGHIG